MANKHLSVCSFNCRSFKNSACVVNDLCNQHDIVLLQETWLLPNELDLLNNVHCDFYSVGSSAVDISSDVLVGRPYGGTAILYRKSLANSIKFIDSVESRIIGAQFDTSIGPLLLLNVYMPSNYNDDGSLEMYIDCLSKLQALLVDSTAAHTLIVGDFNCSNKSRFFPYFAEFALDNKLVMSDINRLTDVFTYVSDDGRNMSWVDHILCSSLVDNLLLDLNIIYDVIISDHKPLSFKIQCHTQLSESSTISDVASDNNCFRVPIWNTCESSTLHYYSEHLDRLLQNVTVPLDVMTSAPRDASYLSNINKFYEDIMSCVSCAISDVIPTRECSISAFNVPGWNTFVREKHEAAREAFVIWLDCGKPRFGPYFENMKRTRALFKLALRYCKNNVEQLKADACAESLLDNDNRKFWNQVYKISNNKSTSYVNSVGGVTGSSDIADMWKKHFEKLYSSGADSKYRVVF